MEHLRRPGVSLFFLLVVTTMVLTSNGTLPWYLQQLRVAGGIDEAPLSREGLHPEELASEMLFSGALPPMGGNSGEQAMISRQQLVYTVRPGDNLWYIADRYGVNVRQLIAYNGLANPNKIYPGQRLVVSEKYQLRHLVRRGETLWGIAKKYDVAVASIAQLNNLSDPSRIHPGQVLKIGEGEDILGQAEVSSSTTASVTIASHGGGTGGVSSGTGSGGNAVGGGIFAWPVEGRITSGFGPRWGSFHYGLDIGAPMGRVVRAAADGTVVFIGWRGTYGRTIIVDHGGGWTTLYAHNSAITAVQGQKVAEGQAIARIGVTGNTTGPHLHFEVRYQGKARDPLLYLKFR